MATEILHLEPSQPNAAKLELAASVLRAGGLVAIPTETVYGLAGAALKPDAVARIFAAKGRPSFNPLIVHVSDVAMAKALAANWPAAADRLAEKFWPGPLTLIVPKAEQVPTGVTAGGETVALRCPAHPVARRLIEVCGFPLAAPSANLSAQLSPTTARHVLRNLKDRIEMILDAGPTPGGIESTVVDLMDAKPRLLRPGPIRRELLEKVLGPIVYEPRAPQVGTLRSPGLLDKHYSPHTPLFLYESARELRRQLDTLIVGSESIGVVGFDQARGISSAGKIRFHPAARKLHWLPDDPTGYASKLYFVLHDLDEMKLNRILLLLPPDEPQWLAVRDRLLRAGTLISSGDGGESRDSLP